MNIIVLMAGDGKRFLDKGYTTPKPFILVNGKTILQKTLDSLPEIKNQKYETLTFAIRKEHEKYISSIKQWYGDDVKFVIFDKLTRGNLETAWLSLKYINKYSSLLILDADNQYNGVNVLPYFNNKCNHTQKFAGICYFPRIDDSIKWGFAITNGEKVTEVIEKDYSAIEKNGSPMVGVFYFSKSYLFQEHAEKIIVNEFKEKNEFYMTQSIRSMIESEIPVYGIQVSEVIPLGTPEDIERIMNADT